jgi:hypothetical protein
MQIEETTTALKASVQYGFCTVQLRIETVIQQREAAQISRQVCTEIEAIKCTRAFIADPEIIAQDFLDSCTTFNAVQPYNSMDFLHRNRGAGWYCFQGVFGTISEISLWF